jgi:DNA polymerase zeta
VKLPIYTFESCAAAVLKRRMPKISARTLATWFRSGPGRDRWRCVDYFVRRAVANHWMVDQLDLIKRTSELARVFGIDFYSVLSRGSQFR